MTKQKARSSGADPAQRSGEGTQLRRRSGARDPEKARSSGEDPAQKSGESTQLRSGSGARDPEKARSSGADPALQLRRKHTAPAGNNGGYCLFMLFLRCVSGALRGTRGRPGECFCVAQNA